MRPYIIYHGNCADGFASAWVLWKYFQGKADFYPGVYQRPPPDVRDRFIIMADFSYKRPVLHELAGKNKAILVIDHHKTAAKDLEPDPMEDVFAVSLGASWAEFSAEPDDRGIYAQFDMARSGCGMTWDFFYPGKDRPYLLDRLEDRDLWKFQFEDSRPLQATAFSYPYEFEVWNEMIEACEYQDLRRTYVREGEAIERKHFKDIRELIPILTRPMRFRVPNGPKVTVPIANLPYIHTSDAGHFLCSRNLYGMTPEEQKQYEKDGKPERHSGAYKHPFAGVYWDMPDGRQFSLRSEKGGADVGEIATLYGGGGHANASGFLVAYEQLGQFDP